MPSESTGKNEIWRAKVAAWVHDPPEKAWVLLREHHEKGTTAKFCQELFGVSQIPKDLEKAVKQADCWSAAADRPQFPREGQWGPKVDFVKEPLLIHPLSGTTYKLEQFGRLDEDLEPIKQISLDHLKGLVVRDEKGIDFRRTFLKLWRLGPESASRELGFFWSLLPADTRVPDHSIWEHLRLTSAFAGCFVGGGNPSLLMLTIGPVQGFIAQARSTSDLWAGSHLLSRMSWEAIKVVCKKFGPDAVLFPDLHGNPYVDLWLEDNGIEIPKELASWKTDRSDASPLFIAALPNRFLAIVPAAQARDTAEEIESTVHDWLRQKGRESLKKIGRIANLADKDLEQGFSQIEKQLGGFPEVTWSVVNWPQIEEMDGQVKVSQGFSDALEELAGQGSFLNSKSWKFLSREISFENIKFFKPNAGTVYPAVYELSERLTDSSKPVRNFDQSPQEGYRCTLCGEREWIALDHDMVHLPAGKRKDERLWQEVHAKGKRAWAREGEYLCALCLIKRAWPRLFCEELGGAVGEDVQRYIVSTHTMALARNLEDLNSKIENGSISSSALGAVLGDAPRVALPRSMAKSADLIKRIPGYLDELSEQKDVLTSQEERTLEKKQKALLDVLKMHNSDLEKYYALILMDGDKMGSWLSGDWPHNMTQDQLWHPSVAKYLPQASVVEEYRKMKPLPSPARHGAISHALNSFSLHAAPYLVEEVFKGKVLYCGGDDLLAMVSIDDLLGLMTALRCAYSGAFVKADDQEQAWRLLGCSPSPKVKIRRGHMLLDKGKNRKVLLRMMGEHATASMGVVIAHHKNPLGAVIRELRSAEQRAKNQGHRDAFSISLLKRSGGTSHLTCPWFLNRDNNFTVQGLGESATGVILRLCQAVGQDLSRRAVYQIIGLLPDLPREGSSELPGEQVEELLRSVIAQKLVDSVDRVAAKALAQSMVELASAVKQRNKEHSLASGQPEVTRPEFIRDVLTVAEFLAREGRTWRGTPHD